MMQCKLTDEERALLLPLLADKLKQMEVALDELLAEAGEAESEELISQEIAHWEADRDRYQALKQRLEELH